MFNLLNSILHDTLFVKYGLLGLFFNGVFSSFLPIPTEITVSALILGGIDTFDIFVILVVSSIIGGYVAYYIGFNARLLKKFRKTPEKKYEQKSINLMTRYGWATIIFFSPWIPIIGDVVSIIAGTKKYDIVKYSIFMTTGKAVKAVAVVFGSVHFLHWLSHLLQ